MNRTRYSTSSSLNWAKKLFVLGSVSAALGLAATAQAQTLTFSNAWSIAAGGPLTTTVAGSATRGICVATNGDIIVANRTNNGVYRLNGTNGNIIAGFNTNGMSGGVNKVDVADDGAIYVCSLTTAVTTTPLRVYKWNSESLADIGTAPLQILNLSTNIPQAGAGRYGDMMKVRGSGINTEIIIQGSASSALIHLKATDAAATTFTIRFLGGAGYAATDGGRGLAFGPGNTIFTRNTGTTIIKRSNYSPTGSTNITAGTTFTDIQNSGIALSYLTNAGDERLVIQANTNAALAPDKAFKIHAFTNATTTSLAGTLLISNTLASSLFADSNVSGDGDIAYGRAVGVAGCNAIICYHYYYAFVPPAFTAQAANQTIQSGGYADLTATVTGTAPALQWFKIEADGSATNAVANATNVSLHISNLVTNDTGVKYYLVASNVANTVTSTNATLTVVESFANNSLSTNVWSLAGGSRAYLPTSGQLSRGLAYNSASNQVLVSSITPALNVLDGDTGAQIRTMNVSIVTGGSSSLFLTGIGAGSDGSIYGCNVTTDITTTALKVYYWANTASGTVPILILSTNITGAGTRYGDIMTVRGGGATAELIFPSRQTQFLVLRSQDATGTNFVAKFINLSGATADFAGTGIAFGVGDTFWTKTRQVGYDFTAGTASVLNSGFSIAGLGMASDAANGFLAGVNTGVSPDSLSIYDSSDIRVTPRLVDQKFFASENTSSGTPGGVAFGNGRFYALNVNNGVVAVAMVTNAPAVLTNTPSLAVNLNSRAQLACTSFGYPRFFLWDKEGTPLSETTGTYNIASAQWTDYGTYNLVISNDLGVVTNTEVLYVNPVLLSQAASRTNVAGTSTTFSVTPDGIAPFTYQWTFAGTNITDATNSDYTIGAVAGTNAGNYAVVVGHSIGGSITSSNAVLRVAPGISVDPAGLSATYDDAVGFTVTADGQTTLRYQWQFNSANILNATNSAYNIAAVRGSNGGDYRVIVTNQYGKATSQVATLTYVKANQTITSFPTITDKTYGDASFGVSGTASTGLPVTFAAVTPNVSVAGSTVSILGIGTAEVAAIQVGNADFNPTAATNSFNIAAAALTVTGGSTNRVYGAANPPVDAVVTGLQYTDDITATAVNAATAETAVGTYANTITLVDAGSKLGNYTVTTNTGSLTITVAALTVTMDDKAMARNTALPTFTGTVSANNDGITLSGGTTPTDGTVAGTFSIFPTLNDPTNKLSNYSVTTNAGTLTVIDAPSIVSGPTPASQTKNQGQNASISISAAGGSLSYQWYFGVSAISGATGSSLTLTNVTPADNGNYHVVITNLVGSVTSGDSSLTVVADTNAPTVKINNPKAASSTASSSYLVDGTIADTIGVGSVYYNVNGSGFVNTGVNYSYFAAAKPTNWNVAVTLTPGTNILEVYGTDLAGNKSATNKVIFFYDYFSTFHLNVNIPAAGTVTPKIDAKLGTPTDGASLRVGRTYSLTVTETAKPNYVFSNWTYSVDGGPTNVYTTNVLKLSFIMQTNLTLNANFAFNKLVERSGVYNGLVYEDDGIKHVSAGLISLKVTDKFAVSGKAYVDGNAVAISGKLSVDGMLPPKILSRAKLANKSDLILTLAVNLTGSNIVTGTLQDGVNWTSSFTADRYFTNPAVAAYTNAYSVVLPAFTNNNDGPVGNGFVTVNVALTGKIKIAGLSGDGLKLGQSTFIGESGQIPFWVGLYINQREITNAGVPKLIKETKGETMGWLTVQTNTPAGSANLAPLGEVAWIKTGGTNPASYLSGFTNQADVLASRWVLPTPLVTTNSTGFITAEAEVSEGYLGTPFTEAFSVSSKNGFVQAKVPAPANGFKIGLTAKSGLIKGQFNHPDLGAAVIKWNGTLLQDYTNGYGSFMATNISGKVIVTPTSFVP